MPDDTLRHVAGKLAVKPGDRERRTVQLLQDPAEEIVGEDRCQALGKGDRRITRAVDEVEPEELRRPRRLEPELQDPDSLQGAAAFRDPDLRVFLLREHRLEMRVERSDHAAPAQSVELEQGACHLAARATLEHRGFDPLAQLFGGCQEQIPA